MLVHHIGKIASRGPRGSNALRGGIDTEIQVTAGFINVDKQRDLPFEQSHKTPFWLEQVSLGNDSSGA